jgi:putative membrane protein
MIKRFLITAGLVAITASVAARADTPGKAPEPKPIPGAADKTAPATKTNKTDAKLDKAADKTADAMPLGSSDGALADDEVLARVHAVNKMEIDLGQIAADHGQSADVKRYGQMLVKDHSAGDKELTALAEKQKIVLREPQPVNAADRDYMARDKADAEHLKTLSGAEFDKTFAQAMLQGHADMIALLGDAKAGTKNQAIKAFYGKTLGALNHHFDMAGDIVAKLQASDETGTGSSDQGINPDADKPAPVKGKPDMGKGDMGMPMDSDDASKIDH